MIDTRLISCLKRTYIKNALLINVIIGVIFAIPVGLLLNINKHHLPEDLPVYLGYPGELFLSALQLAILPFIICCVTIGTTKLDMSKNGSIAIKVIILFFLGSLFSAILGTALGVLLHPGNTDLNSAQPTASSVTNITTSHIKLPSKPCENATLSDTLLDLGRNILTNNVFAATFRQRCSVRKQKIVAYNDGPNTLGLTFFFILFGSILGMMDHQKEVLLDFITCVYNVLQKMLVFIIWFTPLCVPCIICANLMKAENIIGTFKNIGYYSVIIIAGQMFYQLVVLQIAYLLIVRKNPFKFYFGILPAIMTGFATASKAASMPMMFESMDKLKQNERITQFVLPLGSMNLSGSCQYMALSLMFLAQTEGIELHTGQLITLVIVTTFASMSMAGVPSAAVVMLNIICTVMNVNNQKVALLYAVDWLLDRFRAPTNIIADCYTIAIVEKLSRKQIKKDEFEEEKSDNSMEMNAS